MAVLESLNLALAFALEAAMLAAFAFFGFKAVDHAVLRWVAALALPAAIAALWGVLLAPKAAHRLPMVPGVALSLGLFLLAALALARAGQPVLGWVLAVAAVVHGALALALRQW
jgi:hypothetical protein